MLQGDLPRFASQENERVRRNTSPRSNWRIDDLLRTTVYAYAGRPPSEIARRLAELDREWDIERILETNASALAFAGVALATLGHRRGLLLSAAVTGFLFLHGTQGWCPPLPLLRRLGVRTRDEIYHERFALKFLRGDFDQVRSEQGVNLTALLAALQR